MEKHNFDFSKSENQVKFETLESFEKQGIIDDALTESLEISRRAKTGEAETYYAASNNIDIEKSNGRLIENKELGISFFETIQELPLSIQNETGVKRLRKRKVVDYPDNLCSAHGFVLEDGVKKELTDNQKIWHALTDGRLPSYKTWTHKLYADHSGKENFGSKLLQTGKFSVFDEFFPEGNKDYGISFSFFKQLNGELMELSAEDVEKMTPKEVKDCTSYFPMSVEDEGRIWSNHNSIMHNAPIFAFGGKNRLFQEYVENLKNNPQSSKILELKGWKLDEALELIDLEQSENAKYKSVITEDSGSNAKYAPKINESDIGSYLDMKKTLGAALRSMDIFNNLFDEKNITYGFHPDIPIVRCAQLKPFRFCFAELAIIPSEKNLEIIFFETE